MSFLNTKSKFSDQTCFQIKLMILSLKYPFTLVSMGHVLPCQSPIYPFRHSYLLVDLHSSTPTINDLLLLRQQVS